MILKVCIKRIMVICLIALTPFASYSQITSGKIVFERKTNLKKMMKDNPRIKAMGIELDTRIEDFALYFNDTASAFIPIEGEEVQGMMKYMTSHNRVYKNFKLNRKRVIMDMAGREMFIEDSIKDRVWKITDRTRKLAGYTCQRAIWEMNDTTRIYAWFSIDIVPSVGPEGFSGLPGAILGVATEDGSVIYFAKTVEVMTPKAEVMDWQVKSKDVYTLIELKAILTEKMGQWIKPKDMDAMFSWL